MNEILSFGFAQDRLCFAPQNDILGGLCVPFVVEIYALGKSGR